MNALQATVEHALYGDEVVPGSARHHMAS
jgi:hypothetical protein